MAAEWVTVVVPAIGALTLAVGVPFAGLAILRSAITIAEKDT